MTSPFSGPRSTGGDRFWWPLNRNAAAPYVKSGHLHEELQGKRSVHGNARNLKAADVLVRLSASNSKRFSMST